MEPEDLLLAENLLTTIQNCNETVRSVQSAMRDVLEAMHQLANVLTVMEGRLWVVSHTGGSRAKDVTGYDRSPYLE